MGLHESSPELEKWAKLLMLWVMYIAFGMTARSIFPLVTPILRDLSISYAQMGMILGSWQLTYIPAALAAGTVLDLWGIRKCMLAGIVVIGFSVSLRFFADGFWFMLFCVALFGIGGPMISIGGPKAIAEWFEGKQRGTAIGVYTTGPWVGGFLALWLTNSLIMPLTGMNWRLTFVCYGGLCFAIAILWWRFSKQPSTLPQGPKPSMVLVFKHLLTIPAMRILLCMSLFSFAVGHGFSSWLPRILETKGMAPADAGLAAALPLATGIPAVLLFPRWVEPSKRSAAIACCAVITIVNLVAVMKVEGRILYGVLCVFGFFSSPFMPMMLLMLMDSPEISPDAMGAAGGMFFCVAEIGGFVGPTIMGILADVTGSFYSGALFLSGLCVALFWMSLCLKPRPGSTGQPF